MRIAITNPTTWPQLRRGVERFMNELATWLSSRGHDVTIITAHPGPTEVRNENNHRTILHRRLWTPALGRAGFLEVHAFALTTFAALMRDSYDIVHCCTFMDAFAARAARRITGTPYIFWVNALPPKILYYKSMSTGGAVFRRAVLGADELIVLSEYKQNTFAERF
ncbi:MAG: glycosyltransferase, partial [Planctomycetota bacterium]|nr:glycosyltransferase [Planctomycetota bacterium]